MRTFVPRTYVLPMHRFIVATRFLADSIMSSVTIVCKATGSSRSQERTICHSLRKFKANQLLQRLQNRSLACRVPIYLQKTANFPSCVTSCTALKYDLAPNQISRLWLRSASKGIPLYRTFLSYCAVIPALHNNFFIVATRFLAVSMIPSAFKS